jgi:hypothetical protein
MPHIITTVQRSKHHHPLVHSHLSSWERFQGNSPLSIETIANGSLTKSLLMSWTWAGELFLDIDQDKADRLCEVTLTDTTDFLPEGLRLHILFSSLDSIRFQKLYNFADLDQILPAFKPSEQVARLGPQNENDIAPLTSLKRHMELKQRVCSYFTCFYNY